MKKNIYGFFGFIITVVVAWLCSMAAFAGNDSNLDLSRLPLQQCHFEKVNTILYMQSMKRDGLISVNSDSTLKEIEKISEKATDKNKPIGVQLSLKDQDKFDSAAQRVQVMNMESLIEGNLQRDFIVMSRLVRLSDNYYRWGKFPNKNDNESFMLFGILAAAEKDISRKDLKPEVPSKIEGCSLDYALFDIEKEPLNKFSALHKDALAAMARAQQIYAKYNSKKMDYSILNADDQSEISYLRNKFILPVEREVEFIRSIELIRHYAKISALIYKSSMADILYSGGDISKVNLTMDNKIRNGELSKTHVWVSGMWNVIDEKIPSDTFKLFKQMSDVISANQKKRENRN